jgi:hypothetical protein
VAVELLERDHRQVDVVLVEAEQAHRVVHEHVGVEHEELGRAGAARLARARRGPGVGRFRLRAGRGRHGRLDFKGRSRGLGGVVAQVQQRRLGLRGSGPFQAAFAAFGSGLRLEVGGRELSGFAGRRLGKGHEGPLEDAFAEAENAEAARSGRTVRLRLDAR